ncbi:hypothetical protein BC829DRAFT_220798 [Chytridium lagenaria]|nr:hypothetical protein BC829DRAFT_220798 [Chytridium lagenaria]
MVSSECADPFGPDRPPPRLDAIGFTNPSPTETTVSYPIAQESFEPPFSESDTRIAPAQEASKETLTLPFTPLTPQTIYGYHRVGSFIASYTSHYIAFLIVLLFVTLPPYPQWSYNYGHITLPDLMIRAITWPILAALFKCVTCSIEGWWGGVNFKESVEEMRVSGLTGSRLCLWVGWRVQGGSVFGGGDGSWVWK